ADDLTILVPQARSGRAGFRGALGPARHLPGGNRRAAILDDDRIGPQAFGELADFFHVARRVMDADAAGPAGARGVETGVVDVIAGRRALVEFEQRHVRGFVVCAQAGAAEGVVVRSIGGAAAGA